MKTLILTAGLVLAACSTGGAPSTPSSGTGDRADSCGASALQRLIGQPRSAIPPPVKPELQRVACTTCPLTLDFNANRVNILFDARTGVIKEVRCG